MLTLIESGFGSYAKDELIKIAQAVVKGRGRGFMIVPEQQTVSAENEISLALGPEAPLYFEVSNFTRFANTVFRAIGGISGEYCTKDKKALIMWRAITELSPMLSLTRGRPEVSSGIVSRAMAAVNEMQALGISAGELNELTAKSQTDDARLKSKLDDLALVYSLYKKLLKEKYNDTQDDVMTLAEQLKSEPQFLKGATILIDGFTSFTEPQYKLIEELLGICDVTITLTLPSYAKESFEFTEQRRTRARLVTAADRARVEKRLLRPTGVDQRRDGVIAEIVPLLWRNEGVIDDESLHLLNEGGERVRIFSARTPFDECDFLAADIKRRVMKGERYRDFAIIARNADSYVGILNTALERAGIPHFISKSTDVTAFEAVKLIYTAYSVAIRGFKSEDVLTYMKCGLCDLTREECDEFELYVQKWNIDGRRFVDGICFNMNPRGYEPMNESDALKLDRIESTRRRLLEPLSAFSADCAAAHTVREHAEALLRFLCKTKLEDRLEQRALELEGMGEVALAEENARLWKLICDCLDTVVDCLGDMKCTAQSFMNQLSVVLETAAVGRIPTHTDEVIIGSADMLRLDGRKHVYLIGVNAGIFPAAVSDNSYFTPKDKAKLSALGLPIEPDLEVKSAREFYCFSRAMSFATRTVTITYNEKSAALGTLKPAEVVERIKTICRGAVSVKKVSSIPIEDRIWSKEDALELLGDVEEDKYRALADALTEKGYGNLIRVAEGDIKNKSLTLSEKATGLLYNGALYLSETRISCFLNCPLEYFCKHTLKLDGQESASFGSNVVGTFIHSILENFFSELKTKGKTIANITKEEKEALTARCAQRYVNDLFGEGGISARARVAIERLKRAAMPVIEGLCDEFKDCKFEPTFFELNIGKDPQNDPMPLNFAARDGGKIIIRGQVDRVDTYKNGDDVYVRVIDYKTGAKEFSPTDLEEGRNLQMFLYLKSIVETDTPAFRERIGVENGGKLIPAGVIYVKTKVDDTTVSKADDRIAEDAVKQMQKREGMILADEISLGAMNERYLPEEPSARSKNGVSRRYTEEGWGQINETIDRVVCDIGSRIREGDIRATGVDENERHCSYCSYRKFCRNTK